MSNSRDHPPRRKRHKPRSKSHKEARYVPKAESQDYLQQLETKLDKAKIARDNYLDYLKKKYPSWSSNQFISPPPYSFHQVHSALPGQVPNYLASVPPAFELPQLQRRSLMSDLHTSQYFWNPPDPMKRNDAYRSVELLNVSEPIPSSSIYLEADMPNVMSKLQQIQANLRDLKEHRLSMPTVEYFRKVAPDLKADLSNLSSSSYYNKYERPDIPSLAELKARILNLDLHVERRSREILDEAMGRRKKRDEKEKMEAMLMDESRMPDWLKERKSIVQEMEEQKVKEEAAEEAVIYPAGRDGPEVAKNINEFVKSEEPEVTIAPTRKIVFAPTTTTATPQPSKSIPLVTKTPMSPVSSPSPSPPPKPTTDDSKTSYNKMLELLRPKSYRVSTSSSSEDEVAVTITSKPKPLATVPAPQTTATPQPSFLSKPASTPATTTPVPAPSIPKPALNLSQLQGGKDDSDDDFFN